MSHTILLSEIQRAMGWKPGLLPGSALRKARHLIEAHGFPRPLPGHSTVWSRAQVEAWLRSGGAFAAPPAAVAPANGNLPASGQAGPGRVAADRRYLEEKYGRHA